MRTKTKAVLLNALVFPGTGQLIMRRRWRGLLYIAVAIGCLVVIFSVVYSIVGSMLADPAAVDNALNNTQNIEDELLRKLSESKNAWTSMAIPLLILVWIIALLDAVFSRTTEPAA